VNVLTQLSHSPRRVKRYRRRTPSLTIEIAKLSSEADAR
jgi:hypothetical protein